MTSDDESWSADQPSDLPAVSAEDDAAVRALLGSLRDDDPIPASVAARLDDALADLVAERSEQLPDPMDDFASRRTAAVRRRRWPTVLVAAAAVSVLGFSAANLLDNTGGADSTTAGDSAGSESARELAEGGAAGPPAAAPSNEDQRYKDPGRMLTPDEVPRIDSSTLTSDLQALARLSASGSHLTSSPKADAMVRPRGCDPPRVPRGGLRFAVLYEGQPATVVFGPRKAQRRTAEVYACDDKTDPVARTSVNAPKP